MAHEVYYFMPHERQMNLLYYTISKLRATVTQSSCSWKHSFMPMYACQLWCRYTQFGIIHFCIAFNNVLIVALHPRNVKCSLTSKYVFHQDIWFLD